MSKTLWIICDENCMGNMTNKSDAYGFYTKMKLPHKENLSASSLRATRNYPKLNNKWQQKKPAAARTKNDMHTQTYTEQHTWTTKAKQQSFLGFGFDSASVF